MLQIFKKRNPYLKERILSHINIWYMDLKSKGGFSLKVYKVYKVVKFVRFVKTIGSSKNGVSPT